MTAPDIIQHLVKRFNDHRDSYHAGKYNETQLRRDFLDPFFVALGWDVSNQKNYSERYREVFHEVSIEVEGGAKAADYAFRVGEKTVFFVEAKKPSVNIEANPEPAFQLRRYGWSAKLPISLLTDFEHLAVYDCRLRPVKTDKPSLGRVQLYHYSEYAEKWDEIAAIFSHEAVLGGAFDQFVEGTAGHKGTTEVDDAFLAEIERWRDLLAHNIALRNPSVQTEREMNFAVQMTIDRIIFLRICEDRGIEPDGQLHEIAKKTNIYPELLALFRLADTKYNSGLFHFADDTLTPGLGIDDRVLKDILHNLYYPESPYVFTYISANILGQVYEQFLGKVIRLTAGHQARVEEKPEVRKAGGVYYTPTYIVDYIVKNTVGKLLEGKTPTEVASLKILDPACGSGSFLLGAYQVLLDWHANWYVTHDPEKWARGRAPAINQADKGEWRLTTSEKKRILLDNIFGVDIDLQAVEVTKLSLLLKVLEGASGQMTLGLERVLPDLDKNIQCGNSLIGSDYFDGHMFVDEEELYRVNAFNWQAAFPQIFIAGGFDVVIGNPPYGFHQIHSDNVKPYYKKNFISAFGSYEHYFLFYEKSLSLLKPSGLHGFIAPVTWLTIPSAHSLREFVLKNFGIRKILWLSQEVFENARVNTIISIIQKAAPGNVFVYICDPSKNKNISILQERLYEQKKFISEDYFIGIFETGLDSTLLDKLIRISRPLKDFARPCSGYNPYEVGKGKSPKGGPQTEETVRTKPYHSTEKLGPEWKPEIIGRDLERYCVKVTGKRWINYGSWLAAPRDSGNFLGKRILVQEITGGHDRRIVAGFFNGELYHSRDVIPIKFDNEIINPFYILGIINSRLITWYHHMRNPKAQKALFPKVLVSDLSNLPMRNINFSDPAEKTTHDRMVSLVERMLSLHKQSARTPQEKEMLQREIESTDQTIDSLVYQLYGLTEAEIKIVEGG